MMNKLLVMLRNAELGKVKSRLAERIGIEEALNVYKWLVGQTIQISSSVDAETILYFDTHLEDGVDKLPEQRLQKGMHLGDKMKYAIQDHIGGDKIVLIGSDCPEITAQILEDSFNLLNTSDLVLGPAHDGGFYLVGMIKDHTQIFENVEWGTDTVLNHVIDNSKKFNLKIAFTKTLHDLDNQADLELFRDQYSNFNKSNVDEFEAKSK